MKTIQKLAAAIFTGAILAATAPAAEPAKKNTPPKAAVRPAAPIASPPKKDEPRLQPTKPKAEVPNPRDSIGSSGKLTPVTLGSGGNLAIPGGSREQPKDPNRNDSRTQKKDAGIDLSQFNRETTLKNLTDPWSPVNGAGNRQGLPGQRSNEEIWNNVGRTPTNSDGKNIVSKRDQQGTTFRVDATKNKATIVDPYKTPEKLTQPEQPEPEWLPWDGGADAN